MQRILQIAALALSIATLTFFACRAQPSSQAPERAPANPTATAIDAGRSDAPTPRPEVYLPASKSGGMFLEHQQAPR